ncbi:hypothetical protein ABZY09_23595 [Streptomyces sp. NPDC002928]|uniref:hypothetical protein n=1 Tax=Streptomyces sp. NPDC002928 TaxID=3154440 RepID=UPI0033A1B946
MSQRGGCFDAAFGSAIMSLLAHSLTDPRAAEIETWEAAVTAMQMGSALFAVTGVPYPSRPMRETGAA